MASYVESIQSEKRRFESKSDRKSLQPSIGWFTPTLIVASFILGLGLALAHYLLFMYLDNWEEVSTIPQSWVTSISAAIGRVFSVCVGVALGTSYTQILWNSLRTRSHKISTIDTLFSLQENPTNLMSIHGLMAAPILWLLGLVLVLVPIGTIFLPGAIIVIARPDVQIQIMSVPTYDFDYRGNNTSFVDITTHALFTMSQDLGYISPHPNLNRITKASALQNSYVRLPSPCGSNCSYVITMPGPELICGNITQDIYNNSNLAFKASTMAFDADAGSDDTSTTDKLLFMLRWPTHGTGPRTNGPDVTYSFMTCTVYYSEYTISMNYTTGIQSSSISKTTGFALDSKFLGYQSLYPQCTVATTGDECPPANFPDNLLTKTGRNVSITYRESNIRAVYDSFAAVFSGSVTGFDDDDSEILQTTILETPMATYAPDGTSIGITVFITLDANILQAYLENSMISMLAMTNQNVSSMVTTTHYTNRYSFEYPERLLIPYAAALLSALVFIVLGLFALKWNGVSANSGGFIQLLCTTKGSRVLDEMTLDNSLGGDDISEELKNLVVRFGGLGNGEIMRSGFGVPSEVQKFARHRESR